MNKQANNAAAWQKRHQAGFGHTGKMFGFRHSGVVPDMVTVAKSLAGGLRLAAVVRKTHISGRFGDI